MSLNKNTPKQKENLPLGCFSFHRKLACMGYLPALTLGIGYFVRKCFYRKNWKEINLLYE